MRPAVWQGEVDGGGYGKLTAFGVKRGAHVYACAAAAGRLPGDKEVARHKCAGPRACCAEDHLEFGSYQENSHDTVRHGNCPLAKLDADKVRALRANADGLTIEGLAEAFAVNVSTVGHIRSRRTWTWVE